MRIAIVNDLPMAIEAMSRAIRGNSAHQIAWTALDGKEAVERCRQDTPDLILMDLIMPGLDGVGATRAIMKETPCGILIVTAAMESNSSKVFEAMGAGALDVVQTPIFSGDGRTHGTAAFLYKIDSMMRLLGQSARKEARRASKAAELIAIGASAGGPAALMTLLSELPADLPAGVVVVQHVDAHFAPGLASWLSGSCSMRIRVAKDGDAVENGTVLIAGSNDHIQMQRGGHLTYTAEPLACSYRPSIDVFFESVVTKWSGGVVGVLLTGMGRDGAAGLKLLRSSGHHTIAQDRASSAVYGMPKAAAELAAATEILPLDEIAGSIRRRFYTATSLSI